MDRVTVYVVSGTPAASAVTPVNTANHTADQKSTRRSLRYAPDNDLPTKIGMPTVAVPTPARYGQNERVMALGRKSWLFVGSERGADRAAAITALITTAKLNDIDPLAWLADVLARITDTPQSRLPDLLPWNWAPLHLQAAA